jgi:hypothetical protein
MANPHAVKLSNTNLGRRLRVLVRGENFEQAYPQENEHIRDMPESAVPRLLQEAFEDVYAKLGVLEAENKSLRKAIKVLERKVNEAA